MTRLDTKLARILAGQYRPDDFIIADAKDPDMGPSIVSAGPHRGPDGTILRNRTRAEFLDQIRAIVRQDILDVMLMSASNLEVLSKEGLFRDSAVKPCIRANDTTDIWVMRGATYAQKHSRPFRSVSLADVRPYTDLGLYSVTFNHDLDADVRSLEEFAKFRADAAAADFRYFLEVFNPNVATGIDPDILPHYINDCIARCLAGVTQAHRPRFLKLAYNGPKALEELASYDTTIVVGVLGGGAGTTRDCFELLAQAEKYGARVALFGRKINLAESPLAMVSFMREVASHNLTSQEATRAYHAELARQGIKPTRSLADDNVITEAVLKTAA
jgi:DhnA family fructose-bisphosphate aldolase class Ia